MANVYVRSGAGGAGTGADWANAYTTLAAALTAKAAGDDFWVAADHAETQASAMTCTSPGLDANPCRIICVDHTGTVPPVSADLRTTATISTTGNNNLTIGGTFYCEGITFTAGATTNNASLIIGIGGVSRNQVFKNCSLRIGGSNISARLTLGNSGGNSQVIRLINTTLSFASVSQSAILKTRIFWENTTSALLGTIPTLLFITTATFTSISRIVGVDLSAAGSGKTLVDQGIDTIAEVNFLDCKLGSSVTIASNNDLFYGSVAVRAVNCDAADTNYRYYWNGYEGTITQETTIIRTDGATDGTTPISLKMVSNANTKFFTPLRSDWIIFWSDTTGAKTVAIPVLTDNVTLTDREAWVEVEYLGTSGFPLGIFVSDAAADALATATNQATDSSSTWTTTGLGTPVKQSLSVNFTTAEKGLFRARVCLAKASTTMYFDPLIASGSRQYMVGEGGYLNSDASGGGIKPTFGAAGSLFKGAV